MKRQANTLAVEGFSIRVDGSWTYENVDEETAWRVFFENRRKDVEMYRNSIIVARMRSKPEVAV